MGRPSKYTEEEHTRIAFAVCDRFLNPPEITAEALAEEIGERFGVSLNRQGVYDLLRFSLGQRFLRLVPPSNTMLRDRLSAKFDLDPERVAVVDVHEDNFLPHLASTAAELLARLVESVGSTKGAVHLGLGSGLTTRAVARDLGELLSAETVVQRLTVHALTAGFAVDRPDSSPVALFNYFADSAAKVEYVGLYASGLVPVEEYESCKKHIGVREAFAERKKIDIIVTSLASATDKHGRFTQLTSMGGKIGVDKLRAAGWVGDVQFRPYAANGAIEVDEGHRSVCLFEINDMIRLAREPDKHVVLVVGPCSGCGQSKHEALAPLLRRPMRIWNWLVVDSRTARALAAD